MILFLSMNLLALKNTNKFFQMNMVNTFQIRVPHSFNIPLFYSQKKITIPVILRW